MADKTSWGHVPTGSASPSRILRESGEEWIAPNPIMHEETDMSHGHEPLRVLEGEPVTEDYDYQHRAPITPLRFAFGDMIGVFFLIWIPVLIAFFVPWDSMTNRQPVYGSLTIGRLIVALIIAVPPWVVLTRHLARGRMWDGILDMLLWALWMSGAMIVLCYLYPGRAEQVIWNASDYWDDMRAWIQTGQGTEGNPALWLPIHGLHLIVLIAGSILFGLPALMMGVLQLNYMNYYVAQVMHASREPLLAMVVAWHFWSVIRVAGYIILASAIYQLEIGALNYRRLGSVTLTVLSGVVFGFFLVVTDAFLKLQYAKPIQEILSHLTRL
jgi:hypothetical protein